MVHFIEQVFDQSRLYCDKISGRVPECWTDDAPPYTAAVTRWERMTQGPLMAAALGFLVAYAWPVIAPGLGGGLLTLCQVVAWATWAFFAVDYLVRLGQASDRQKFVVRNLFDLIVIALPLLRPLRLLRLVTLLRVVNRRASSGLRGRVATYMIGGSALLACCGALAVLDAERGQPGANITNLGDAIWWAITTMTTVGYGDRFPVTGTGRLVAAGLMVGGIALLGVVTATLASWLVERVAEETEASDVQLTREIAALREQVARLSAQMEERDNRR
jgi:voltage-gated potassium channel